VVRGWTGLCTQAGGAGLYFSGSPGPWIDSEIGLGMNIDIVLNENACSTSFNLHNRLGGRNSLPIIDEETRALAPKPRSSQVTRSPSCPL
jgi:hypothetical protein